MSDLEEPVLDLDEQLLAPRFEKLEIALDLGKVVIARCALERFPAVHDLHAADVGAVDECSERLEIVRAREQEVLWRGRNGAGGEGARHQGCNDAHRSPGKKG
jgi:hypothetical protein